MKRMIWLSILMVLSLTCSRDWSNPLSPSGNNEHSIPTNGLIAYYPFNGNSNDESGNENHGEVYGPVLTSDRFGITNHAYDFDGTNDYITSNSIIPIGNSARSISVWFNTTSAGGSNGWNVNTVISWGAPSTNNLCSIGVYGGKLHFGAFGTTNDVYTNQIVNKGNWHHAVVTFDGLNFKFYLDAIQVASENRNFNTFNSRLFIGRRVGQESQYMNGKIDDVRIFNKVISQQEIQSLYKEGGWQ